jgi:hypothetical protein
MKKNMMGNIANYGEPVHPMIIGLYDDLIKIYKFIKENHQQALDAAFDNASKEIGFVVTTTIPVTLQIGESGNIESIKIGPESLKDTIFEKELNNVFKIIRDSKIPETVKTGSYNIVVFWYDAMKLKLRKDWLEPAHSPLEIRRELTGLSKINNIYNYPPYHAEMVQNPIYEDARRSEEISYFSGRHWLEPAHPPWMTEEIRSTNEVRPVFEAHEPAQWIDKMSLISIENSVLISAIDEVYPELKLSETIRSAPTRQFSNPEPSPWKTAIDEIIIVLNKYQRPVGGYGPIEPAHLMPNMEEVAYKRPPGVREPAHPFENPNPSPWMKAFEEIAAVLSKYNYLIKPKVGDPNQYPHMEPAHYQSSKEMEPLIELTKILRKYGYQI